MADRESKDQDARGDDTMPAIVDEPSHGTSPSLALHFSAPPPTPSRPESGIDTSAIKRVAADPLIGQTIAGRFTILSLIARGGMGRVYKAEQAALGRVCAVKVLSPKYDGERNMEFHKRFLLEASTVSKLTHPNTVRIFDYGEVEEQGIYYIAMEYLSGRTLAHTLKEDGAFDAERAARVTSNIARSLREAHAAGVVHRDLKPSNVLLLDRDGEGDDEVKVLDFGLVKSFVGDSEDLTETGMFMGSPKYMAPEQILGHAIGPFTDVYSLGVLFFEMLTGRVPFDKGVGTLVAHVNDPVPTFASLGVTRHAPEVEALVRRCLAKDPADRFASMSDLLRAIRGALGGPASLLETHEGLARVSTAPEPPRPSSVAPTNASPASPSSPPSSTLPSASASPPSAPPPESATLRGASVPQSTLFSHASERPPFVRSSRSRVAVALISIAGAAIAAALVVRSSGPDPDAPVDKPNADAHEPAPESHASRARPSFNVHILRVESEPPGANVHENGKQLCTATPCQVTWTGDAADASHDLTIEKVGCKALVVPVAPDQEKVAAKLEWTSFAGDAKSAEPTASADPSASTNAAASDAPSGSPKIDAPAQAAPVAGVVASPVATAAPVATQPPRPVGPVAFAEGMTRPTMISGSNPAYTRAALEARVEGTMILKCTIETSGAVSNCRVLKGLPYMNDAVLAAMATRRYTPVTYQGKPVAVEYVFNLKLVLP